MIINRSSTFREQGATQLHEFARTIHNVNCLLNLQSGHTNTHSTLIYSNVHISLYTSLALKISIITSS